MRYLLAKGLLICCTVAFNFITGWGQVLTSSNLPIIVLNTNGNSIVDEPKIVADMGVIYNGPGQRNNLSDPFNDFSGKIAIEIRGSSSQMFPKKQYGFELIDQSGLEINASLLGLPPENDWILFAPYNDKSLIRDVLAYKLARDLGNYASRTVYCELVLNGQYQGIYVLMEKIKRDVNRVDINKLDPTENSGDDLTGGYIIKIDKNTGDTDPGWYSEYPPPGRNGQQRINFLYEYPDAEEISFQQREYIKDFLNDFEITLKSDDYADPIDGYARFIDVDSFIDFLIINEMSKNVDGYRLSTYMHKQRNSDGGKLIMGPVWDFNLGFGNADYCNGWTTTGLAFAFNSVCPGDWWLVPFWWNRLLEDASFAKKLSKRWTDLRNTSFSDDKIMAWIDSVAISLSESQVRNFQRWPVLGTHIWPNYFVGSTYAEEVNWLKTWIISRNQFLDSYFGNLVTSGETPAVRDVRVMVYPNPSANAFNFLIESDRHVTIGIEIYDVTGIVLEDYKLDLSGRSNEFSLDKGLSPGCYFYKIIESGNVIFSGKIIKR